MSRKNLSQIARAEAVEQIGSSEQLDQRLVVSVDHQAVYSLHLGSEVSQRLLYSFQLLVVRCPFLFRTREMSTVET